MLELQCECDLLLEQLDRHRVGDSQDSAWIARSRERREAVGVLLFRDDQIRPVFSCAIPDFPGFVYSRKIVSTLGGILAAGLSWPRAIPDIPAVSKTTRASTAPAILLIVDLLGRTDSTDFSF